MRSKSVQAVKEVENSHEHQKRKRFTYSKHKEEKKT